MTRQFVLHIRRRDKEGRERTSSTSLEFQQVKVDGELTSLDEDDLARAMLALEHAGNGHTSYRYWIHRV